eukprot:3843224-Rhodomonas_salina.2
MFRRVVDARVVDDHVEVLPWIMPLYVSVRPCISKAQHERGELDSIKQGISDLSPSSGTYLTSFAWKQHGSVSTGYCLARTRGFDNTFVNMWSWQPQYASSEQCIA